MRGLSSLPIPVHRADLTASLVVFLVALPLCVGVAVASGVPAELGLITGIVGGLLVGLLPGSSLQVSGPAAGLTVLVFEAVQRYGIGALGVLVLGAGVVQIVLGVLRLERWFRAVSVAVVQGMLAGIGIVLMAGQVYVLAGAGVPESMAGKLSGLPGLVSGTGVSGPALAVGAGTVAVLVAWPRWRRAARVLPAPLVAVGLAAVDRMHQGRRTDYDKELIAQGAGNTVCGALGALPMTAVIVRSSANVHAGARTKASRVLHGLWLLLFVAALPGALGVIPVAALAGVLVHAGFKLVPLRVLVPLWRGHRGEAVVLGVTTVTVVATSLFEGVLVGLLLAVAKTAWDVSHVHVETVEGAGVLVVRVIGNATFLRLPKLLDALDALPADRKVELELSGLRHTDHACAAELEGWAAQREARQAEGRARAGRGEEDGQREGALSSAP
ncbi:SulP family inorganic anion transporter [Streptomyces arboris]|uniref:SulP family inorganic anion transporter n=1 Tax=Streptomyces arboris TaxID=2600619 RepID=UPI001CEF79F0|nr:SulP family inorganic anion transporter [Streptomyces arboris]